MNGFALWFTGLSGSGKSTLTAIVAAELRRRGVHVETLDGDEIRKHLSKGLGFSKEDRDANVRRVGFVARLVARSGGCAIAAAISPYREVRDEVRQSIGRFCEVYCECPVDVLSQRDPKGLYERALRGEIKNFTGVDDPYEAPEQAEVHLRTDRESPEESAARIVRTLESLGYIPDWSGRSLNAAHDAVIALNPPHGGALVDRIVPSEARAAARASAEELPRLVMTHGASMLASALASGLFSPLSGFMGAKDYLLVQREMRLEAGARWPVPILLPVPSTEPLDLSLGRVALTDDRATILGTLEVHELWSANDLPAGATDERAALGSGRYLAGELTWFAESEHGWTPKTLRQRFLANRSASVTALSVPDGWNERERSLVRSGAAISDELVTLRWHEAGAGLWPPERPVEGASLEVGVPHPPLTDERSRLLELIVAKNLGAHRVLVPRAVGGDASDAALWLAALEIGIDRMPYPRG